MRFHEIRLMSHFIKNELMLFSDKILFSEQNDVYFIKIRQQLTKL